MSNQHIKRLKQVLLEREAAQEATDKAATYALSNPDFYEADYEDLARAARNAERTYYFRLTAELEGMLFRHLREYHAGFQFDSKDGAADLVNYCRHQLDPRKGDHIPNDLADDVLRAVRWRNHLVHGERTEVPPDRITFNEAYQYIHDLILLLPEMKDSRV